jgi:hypothetical protein
VLLKSVKKMKSSSCYPVFGEVLQVEICRSGLYQFEGLRIYLPGNYATRLRRLLAAMIVMLLFTFGSVGAQNVKHDRLAALLSNPGSDLSSLKGDYNLEAAARLDARLYAQHHKRRANGNNCLGIGLEHAVKHHLKGRAIDVYALGFDAACSAFFEK